MYIVIAGGGIAGSVIAAALVDRKHDVVVIEPNPEACSALYAKTGAVTIQGSATDVSALQEAGIEKADLAISCMYRDNDNMSFALLAHSYGVKHIIAKMRDPAFEPAYRAAGVTVICNIIRMLQDMVLQEVDRSVVPA